MTDKPVRHREVIEALAEAVRYARSKDNESSLRGTRRYDWWSTAAETLEGLAARVQSESWKV